MRSHAMTKIVLPALLIVLVAAAGALAWHGPGHDQLTTAAVKGLPKDMPAFFAAGVETIAHVSQDPDLFRLPDQPELRDAEVPEHFFDIELLEGAEPPATRSAFVQLCAKKGIDPAKVGFLPYQITEWTQRLALAFAECRKWPENKAVQAKCLVYAGLLAHYAQDACQPLHTTIHYDGRVGADGKSPRSGVHARLDALIATPPVHAAEYAVKVSAFDKLLPAVWKEIQASHALVGKVYELEKDIPAEGKPAEVKAVADFIAERRAAATSFTASLYLTAWTHSATLALPEWDKR